MRLGGERRGGLRRAGALPQVLDALTVIYVYLGADWAETCPEGMQFPPGKQSALWSGVMQLRFSPQNLHTCVERGALESGIAVRESIDERR